MNAMSVSPVKPTLNPGNHAVPAATNLTKSPLPSSNFAPINLIPETKPISAVNAAPANTENSVDLCSKPPTSNGIVSPVPETNSKENSANVPQNHNENSIAENLTTTDSPEKPSEVVSEVKNVEKLKPEEPKNITASKENTDFVKENAPIISGESTKETIKDVKPVSEEKKLEPAVNEVKDVKEIESQRSESNIVEINSEAVPEPRKETLPEIKSTAEKAKEQKELECETNNEKGVENEENKTDPSLESTPAPKPTKRKAKQPVEPVEDDGKEGRKSKRVRLPTQPYQSPIPELSFIAKLQTPAKPTPKATTDKIIAFFKNEFLAVRNPEGSFYICQTFQNIHRSSSRIKIRWFTNLPNDEFTPDFCDVTEFDCILTNVQMTRVEKDRWKLPEFERTRIENILKRALDVEKGVADKPSITEEHPDGLDLSLFKDEAQLKKKKKKKSASPKAKKENAAISGTKKKSKSKKSAKTVAAAPVTASTKKSARLSNLSQTTAKETATEKSKPVENKTKKDKKKNRGKQGVGTKASPGTKHNDKTKVWEPSVKSSNSSKVILSLKKETLPAASKASATGAITTKTATKRTSSVSSRASATSTSPVAAVPQKRRKDEPKSAAANQTASNERTGKVRNAGSAVAAKINSAAMRTTKEKERKVSNASSQRKK